MADAPAALRQIRNVLLPGGTFILEFANKRNLKSILRYFFRRQSWNPFSPESVEFAPLNFDFHPTTLRGWLTSLGYHIERTLPVSHFRVDLLKRLVPPALLAGLDSIFQWTGAWGQFSPSIFVRAGVPGMSVRRPDRMDIKTYFKCPECNHSPLSIVDPHILCPNCGRSWNISNGIYDFRGDEP